MDREFREALAAGYERTAAESERLDRINVFPVADGDTGRNLAVSLAPLRRLDLPAEALSRALLLGARGNSGNIAARFFEGFLGGGGATAARAARGRDLARTAVAEPKRGTMLTYFEDLAAALAEAPGPEGSSAWREALATPLERSVQATRGALPELARAGVVDAGALGMHLFFAGFLDRRAGRGAPAVDDTGRLAGTELADPATAASPEAGFCLDVVLRGDADAAAAERALAGWGESVVAVRRGEYLKIHLHAADPEEARRRLAGLGVVERWSVDDLGAQTAAFAAPAVRGSIHLVTDAAGSFTREDARALGVTLLDSYVAVGDAAVPETRLDPVVLYAALRRGERCSTSQASVEERRLRYERLLSEHGRVLYLCVGSVYTGNHAAAQAWVRERGAADRFTVVDSGAASGRLGLAARLTARRALEDPDPEGVIGFARRAVAACREWVFLDELRWLAAGGRLSKASAFFGDLLHVKPIISPEADGARKVGTVRRSSDQLPFALARLAEVLGPAGGRGTILLQYADHRGRVEGEIAAAVQGRFPAAELLVRPLSLTSGTHMGPGTWAAAVWPAEAGEGAAG